LEIHRGRVREKPGMRMDHNRDRRRLVRQLNLQLDDAEYEVSLNSARLRAPSGAVYIPDVAVIPTAMVDAVEGRDRRLETYAAPVPLVVEIWSPATGNYDVDTKFDEYRARGDQEIWRLHPIERTLTYWRGQADGTYVVGTATGGVVEPIGLPGARIDLDRLFARR
jgi:Uma2 family endonuclease